jgi:LacI family transcriptional regulator
MIIAFNHRLASGFGRRLLNGVLAYAAGRTDLRLWFPLETSIAQETPQKVDGIIGAVHDAGLNHASSETAVVNVNSESCEGSVQVCSDNRAIGQLAFDHFHARNIRSFAFLKVETMLSSKSRCPSFVESCAARGFPMFVLPCDDAEDVSIANRTLVDSLLALPRLTGVLLPQDKLGPRLITLCSQIGIRVPDDIGVLGINDDAPLCEVCKPSLSSINIAAETIGNEAIRTVVSMIKGHRVPSIKTIPPVGLVQRESTDCQIQLGPDVQSALDFMQNNLGQAIEKADLIREQTLGRRSLEKHFKAILGESPMQHLQTLRLQMARHLIETTNLTVVKIGTRCGIPDANYLCRLFRTRFGRSPLQHRQHYVATP